MSHPTSSSSEGRVQQKGWVHLSTIGFGHFMPLFIQTGSKNYYESVTPFSVQGDVLRLCEKMAQVF